MSKVIEDYGVYLPQELKDLLMAHVPVGDSDELHSAAIALCNIVAGHAAQISTLQNRVLKLETQESGTDSSDDSVTETWYTFTRVQLNELLAGTISMFIEYRDIHGKTEENARFATVNEIFEGLDAERELVDAGECKANLQVIALPDEAVVRGL